jgi:hypothetical protein
VEKTSLPDLSYSKANFYVVAHADDWQLFMQPNAYYDLITPDGKVIFIITTAGEAGADEAFCSAREEGCKSSIRFCLAPLGSVLESSGTREINSHPIRYWSANSVTCYFLRLPDGNLDGSGFSSYNYQSLTKLREGEINTITAIDNSSTYTSWPDFCNTIQGIFQLESNDFQNASVNYINPDTSQNPNDHNDHIATGQAIPSMAISSNLRQALFVGYSSRHGTENLPMPDLFWKAGMFAAYEKAVYDISGYSTLKEGVHTYTEWCMKSAKFIIANAQTTPNSLSAAEKE